MSSPHLLRRLWFDGLMFFCNKIVGNVPSHGIRKFFYRRAMKFRIGRDSYIFSGARFDARGGLEIGNETTINEFCRLDNRGGVVIGHNVSISSETCILTADHDPQSPVFAGRQRAVQIEDYVFIGTRAVILPGVKVGRGAIVAAAAVVAKDVPALTIVAGCPAKEIGRRDSTLDYRVAYCRLFA